MWWQSLTVACLLVLAVSSTCQLQNGNIFPQGIIVGDESTNCTAQNEGQLRYDRDSGYLLVCGPGGVWSFPSGEPFNGTASLTALLLELHKPSTLQGKIFCSGNGVFNPEDDTCSCYGSNQLGHYRGNRCSLCVDGWEFNSAGACVVDVEKPVIEFQGDPVMTVEAGIAFNDPFVFASDNHGGNVTEDVVYDDYPLPNVPRVVGTYYIVYRVTDASGNSQTATRTVVVIDTTNPSINIIGDVSVSILLHSEYIDAGASFTDNAEWPELEVAIDTSLLDISTAGVYSVFFTFTDGSGNVAPTLSRTVTVIETHRPCFECGCSGGYFGPFPESNVVCDTCPEGNYCNNNATEPQPCAEGTFSVGGAPECDPCEAGYYADTEGTVTCDLCPLGHQCADSSISPAPCPSGENQYHFGQTTCALCHGDPSIECPPVAASSCQGILEANPSTSFPGAFYVVDAGMPYVTYCVGLNGKAYDAVLNLESRDSVARGFTDSDFWTTSQMVGSATAALSAEYKGEAFSRLVGNEEAVVYYHQNGAPHSYASYNVLNHLSNATFLDLMQFENAKWTGERVASNDALGIPSSHRTDQTLAGDVFVDFEHPIVLNRKWGWMADVDHVRIATTLQNHGRAHTYAGIGGLHLEASWGLNYESSPIHPYCPWFKGYGSSSSMDGNYVAVSGYSFPYSCSEASGASFIDVDVAILVLGRGYRDTAEAAVVDSVAECGNFVPTGKSCGDIYEQYSPYCYLADGVYSVSNPDESVSARDTFCRMETATDEGGFDLLMTLITTDSDARTFEDSSFWEGLSTVGSLSAPLNTEFKGDAYSKLVDINELKVVVHAAATPLHRHVEHGEAVYTVRESFRNSSLRNLMENVHNIIYTHPRSHGEGSISGLSTTSHYANVEGGDVFLNHGEAIVLNRDGGWLADVNRERVATTLTGYYRPHMIGGIGGHHVESGWFVDYEFSPLQPYCTIRDLYGSDSTTGNYVNPGGGSYMLDCSHASGFAYYNAHVSIYAKGAQWKSSAVFDSEALPDCMGSKEGRSCDDIANTYSHCFLVDGTYPIVSDGGAVSTTTYCRFEGNGVPGTEAGYDLIMNLDLGDSVFHPYLDTSFWESDSVEGSISSALSSGFKSEAFSALVGLSEVSIIFNEPNSPHSKAYQKGLARYIVKDEFTSDVSFQNASLLSFMQGQNVLFTGVRVEGSDGLGLHTTSHRSDQPLVGDPFIDYSDPLVLNRQEQWGAQTHKARISTTLSNNARPHTFSGIGGWHVNSGWAIQFEAAPIHPYCNSRFAYRHSSSTDGNHQTYTTNNYPLSDCSPHSDFQEIATDVSIFARGREWLSDPDPAAVTTLQSLQTSCTLTEFHDTASCQAIAAAHPTCLFEDGLYTLHSDGNTWQTYCMFHGGRGYDLVLTLSTDDTASRHYEDTAFWESTTSVGSLSTRFSNDFRGDAFNNLRGHETIMVIAHKANSNNGGYIYGHAVYPVRSENANFTFQEVFSTMLDVQMTDARTRHGGASPLPRNSHRTDQTEWGDLFVDHHAEPLVFNKQSGWNADENKNRIATTLTNGLRVHTYAGLGGRHVEGGWGHLYESAPIEPYCNRRNGYNVANNIVEISGLSRPWDGCSAHSDSASYDVSFSILASSKE